MAVPVGITALELNNNVIQKASTKHYLHNILLKLYKGSIYHCKSTSLIFTIKEEQCDNNKKGITTESIEKQKPLSNRSENRSEEIIATHTHTCAHTKHMLPTLNESHLHVRMVLPGVGEGPQC